jgi:NAD(P)-dependent dehydrogenase (short-subunit alcohol dehydrogenase family)
MIDKLFNLEGKVAIVTGASKGLGYSMAEALAGAGANVVLVARTILLLEELAEKINKSGHKALPIQCDISDYNSVQKMVEASIREMGGVDILINNAGIATSSSFKDQTYEEWERHIQVNLSSAFSTCKAVGPFMVKKRKGKVINIASVLGVRAIWDSVSYSTTKGALIQFTRALAFEWARYKVNVNAIAPGYFKTERAELLEKYPDTKRKIIEHIPFGRMGEPEELNGAVIFLSSAASDYMTGETVFVDGGFLTC